MKRIFIVLPILVGGLLGVWYFFNRTPSVVDLNSEILQDIIKDGVACGLSVGNCTVDKVAGDYAKGTLPQAYWLAQKISGTWKVVVTGNGIPACTEIDKYSIPKDIFGNCIESTGQLRF